MARNRFSSFKQNEMISVSPIRRIAHSTRDKGQSMWRHKTDSIESVANIGLNVVGAVSVGASAVGVAGGAAAVVGATGLFVAAMTGPQAGVALGVIGLVVLLKSTYSNREAAHKKLSGHVWSFIDDDPPTQIGIYDEDGFQHLAAAALSLLIDGRAQFDIMNSKLSAAYSEYELFRRKYNAPLHQSYASTGFRYGAKLDDSYFQIPTKDPKVSPADYKQSLIYHHSKGQEAFQLFEEAIKPGGTVFNFLRRLNHFGNYLQAPIILAESLMSSGERKIWHEDQIAKHSDCRQLRGIVNNLAESIDNLSKNLNTLATTIDSLR